MPVRTDRATLALDLRTYGEDELAKRVETASDDDLERVFDRADDYLYRAGGGLLAKALAQGAVDVFEGISRDLKRKRRKLKGIVPEPGSSRVSEATPADAEAPRDVFARAAAAVAAHFEASGWRYSRSGPHLSRRADPFTLRLHLGTSSYNTRGALVNIDVAATVHSSELKRWRAEQVTPLRHDDVAAAGQIGNLASQPTWLDWNLAGDEDAVVAEVIATIERLALPWLESFEDPDVLADRLSRERMPNMDPENAIEVLVWLGRRVAAEDHARLWHSDLDETRVADAVAAYELQVRR